MAEWPFSPYINSGSGFNQGYMATPNESPTYPYYPPWYKPPTNMPTPYSPGAMTGGGAPPTPPGGTNLPVPSSGNQPEPFKLPVRSLPGDIGSMVTALGMLGRNLSTGQLSHLFGSPQGDPNVKQQIQDQFHKSGQPGPFDPETETGQSPQQFGANAAPVQMYGNVGAPVTMLAPHHELPPLPEEALTQKGLSPPPTPIPQPRPQQTQVPLPSSRPDIPGQPLSLAPPPAQSNYAPSFSSSPAYMGEGSTPGNASMILKALLGGQ